MEINLELDSLMLSEKDDLQSKNQNTDDKNAALATLIKYRGRYKAEKLDREEANSRLSDFAGLLADSPSFKGNPPYIKEPLFDDKLITTEQLANIFNMPVATINKNRSIGLLKLPYVKIGHQVRYGCDSN